MKKQIRPTIGKHPMILRAILSKIRLIEAPKHGGSQPAMHL